MRNSSSALPRRPRSTTSPARSRRICGTGRSCSCSPGTFGSFIFAKTAHDAGNRADVAFAETGTLPWLTRKHGPHEVADHHPRQAAADRRISAAAEGARACR